MNDLIRIDYNSDRPTVSARELHKFLEVGTPFHKWFPRMCEYGFIENVDFLVTDIFVPNSNGGKQSQEEAQLTIEMAKEISMLQRNEKGKLARRYFIELEEKWNSPEMIMKRALEFADAMVKELEGVVEENKPKVLFADAVTASKDCVLVRELAKFLKQNGVDIGQNRLFQRLRDEGYLIKTGDDYNTPTQKAMDLKLFEVEKFTFTRPDGQIKTKPTTKVTGKGQQYFINKFLKEKNQH